MISQAFSSEIAEDGEGEKEERVRVCLYGLRSCRPEGLFV